MNYVGALFGLWLLYKILVGFRLMIRGITKLRFTLQSMMTMTIVAGACAALLRDPENQIVFSLGIASTMVATGFLVSYLIILGIYEKDQPYIITGKGELRADVVVVQSAIRNPQSEIVTSPVPSSAPQPAYQPSSGAS